MRALAIHPGPYFSVADVYRGWVRGLRANGVEVAEFNLDERLTFYCEVSKQRDGHWIPALPQKEAFRAASNGIKAACYDYQPDVLLIISAFYIPLDFYDSFRRHGTRVVVVHTESPYEDDRQLTRAPLVDLNILNDPTNIEKFREVAPTIYLPHAYDPTVHMPREPVDRLRSDFAFVGTGFGSRVAFFEQVDWSGIDATFAGNWRQLDELSPLYNLIGHPLEECCPNDEAALLYASTKASVNLYRKEASHSADGWAMGPREVELAACGTFFLREPRGEGDELLPMLPTFTDAADFEHQLRWWLTHDEPRIEAARKAREAVTDRTFTNNVAEALRALGI